MTTYQFGSLFTGEFVEKSFKTDAEAFEFASEMTDGAKRIPIWKSVDNKWYIWYQRAGNDGEWAKVLINNLS